MSAAEERPIVASRERLASLASAFRYPEDPELQAVYTTTFDLGPSCSPYLGVHLFSEEGRDRARLMVGLKLAYRRGGKLPSAELPDHISEVLAFAPHFGDEEWADLVRLVLIPALTKMNDILGPTSNPYRLAVAAAAALCRGGNS